MSNAPIIIVPRPDEVLAVARSMGDAAEAFRAMQNRLGLSNAFCDEAGGFGEGHTNKFLGPTGYKNLGAWSFQMYCSIFAVEWRMHIDPAQIRKMEHLWESRKPQYVQPLSRAPSKEIIERAKPHVVKALGSQGGTASSALLTPEQRSERARKAAIAKHRKARRMKRLARAVAGALRV